MQLLDLVNDPKTETNPRIVHTLEDILRKLQEWLSANGKVFQQAGIVSVMIKSEIEALVRNLADLKLR
jgi:hypothetical protein